MNKYKYMHIKTFVLLVLLVITSILLLRTVTFVNAQSAIFLSITPPIFETMIQPGKEVKQTYVIENLGGDTTLTPKIVYFVPSDENGNVNLTDTPAPEWVKYDKSPITIKNQGKIDYNVIISPPLDSLETDHFLTLVFVTSEAYDILGQNSSLYKTEIGSNILLTISKDGNPKKQAEISLFKAPKVIDSLSDLNFQLTLLNNGNSFWKPTGKINVTGTNLDTTLTLAPLNIVSGYSRKIPCIENEELIDCKITKKPLIGVYEANLEFRMNDSTEVKRLKVTTLAFPFSIIIMVSFVFLVILKLRNYLTKKI